MTSLPAGAIHTSYCHGKRKAWYKNAFSDNSASMFPGTLAYNPETYPKVHTWKASMLLQPATATLQPGACLPARCKQPLQLVLPRNLAMPTLERASFIAVVDTLLCLQT